MEVSFHEVTILSRCDFASSFSTDAAGSAGDCTVDMRQIGVVSRIVFGTDWPFGDVIRPLVRRDRGRLYTRPGILMTHRAVLSVLSLQLRSAGMVGPFYPYSQSARTLLL